MSAVSQNLIPAKRESSRAWRKLKANRSSLVGFVIIIFFALLAVLAPVLPITGPGGHKLVRLSERLPPPPIGWVRMIWAGISFRAHDLGRAGLADGRCVSVAIAVVIGVPFGVLAGYFGGWVRSCDFPHHGSTARHAVSDHGHCACRLPRAKPDKPMIAIGLSAMPIFVRLTRGQVLAVKQEDYVEGARSVGLGHMDIMLRYILPNVTAPIIVQATLRWRRQSLRRPRCPSWGLVNSHRRQAGAPC